MNIIDTHAHLDHVKDLGRVLKDADNEGVEAIIAVSEDLASCRKNLKIHQDQKKPKIYLAMGMHPSEATLDDLEACLELVKEQKSELTAVGEIGLDFWYKWVRKDDEKKDAQRKVFQSFLETAKDLDLPAIIHTRGTWRECFETVKGVGIEKAEFHWYSGPIDVLKDILDRGYYVSASPSLAYSPQSREAIEYAPIERVLIETDSPVFYKNGDNNERFQAEPKDVFRTLKAYCSLKNVEEAYAVEVFNRNAREFFHLV